MRVCHLIVYGYVQGVGYRKFVRYNAERLELVGWVRNLPEGTVEAEVAGPEDRVEELITICKKGPMLSEITAIDVEWMEKDVTFTSFEIRREVDQIVK